MYQILYNTLLEMTIEDRIELLVNIYVSGGSRLCLEM